jgi:hypothetical protein
MKFREPTKEEQQEAWDFLSEFLGVTVKGIKCLIYEYRIQFSNIEVDSPVFEFRCKRDDLLTFAKFRKRFFLITGHMIPKDKKVPWEMVVNMIEMRSVMEIKS